MQLIATAFKTNPVSWISREGFSFSLSNKGNIVRFYPPQEDMYQEALKIETPSFAIDPPLPVVGPSSPHFPIKPRFYTAPKTVVHPPIWQESSGVNDFNNFESTQEKRVIGALIEATPGTHFYGGGEQASRLSLNGRSFVTWNRDAFNYNTKFQNLYQSTPYVMVLRPDGTAYGVLCDTTYPVRFQMDDSGLMIETLLEKPFSFSLVIFDHPNPEEVVQHLAEISGKIVLPPRWSIGYHQCRWSYYPDTQAMKIATDFRNKKIPCDVIWFDIHYMDGYRIFTFDKSTFPDPAKLNHDLHELGFRTVWMIDPGIKREVGYSIHDEAVAMDLCIKTKRGQNFVGPVWPGDCVFPDFTMKETREWWGGLYKDFMAKGVDGVWNDMNEPAVFSPPTATMPGSNVHRGFGGGDHYRFHNIYGMQMIRASIDGILKANPDKRPFVLSRSNFLGGQKYGATWTGDNTSNWTHLGLSIPMVLNLGLSGQPFSGPDIGGFFNNATPSLYARWIGFGALLPFSRSHTHEETDPHEPWAFGENTEQVARIALGWRYKLLLYFYTLFRISSTTGKPIAKPLFFLDPTDQTLRHEDQSFLIGDDILVIISDKENNLEHQPNLPKKFTWYDLQLDEEPATNPDLPKLKVKGGSIIPLRNVIQNVDDKPLTELTLLITLDTKGEATGQYYDDRGDGFEYQNGEYYHVYYQANLNENTITVNAKIEGNLKYPDIPTTIKVLRDSQVIKTKTFDNVKFPLTFNI